MILHQMLDLWADKWTDDERRLADVERRLLGLETSYADIERRLSGLEYQAQAGAQLLVPLSPVKRWW